VWTVIAGARTERWSTKFRATKWSPTPFSDGWVVRVAHPLSVASVSLRSGVWTRPPPVQFPQKFARPIAEPSPAPIIR
jgi:hypothetical protein